MQPVGMCDTLHRGVWPFTVEAGSRIVRLARHGVTEELAVATESRRWNACISSALALALAAMAVWAGPSTPAAALAGPRHPQQAWSALRHPQQEWSSLRHPQQEWSALRHPQQEWSALRTPSQHKPVRWSRSPDALGSAAPASMCAQTASTSAPDTPAPV